jgi:hypothetical protein
MHSALAIRARATAPTAQLRTWRIVIRSSWCVLDPALILDIPVELGGAVMRTSGPVR